MSAVVPAMAFTISGTTPIAELMTVSSRTVGEEIVAADAVTVPVRVGAVYEAEPPTVPVIVGLVIPGVAYVPLLCVDPALFHVAVSAIVPAIVVDAPEMPGLVRPGVVRILLVRVWTSVVPTMAPTTP